MLLMMVITMGVVGVLLMFLFGGEICLNLLCLVVFFSIKKSSTQMATTPTTAALQVWDTPALTKVLTKDAELVAEAAEALATSITILATTPT